METENLLGSLLEDSSIDEVNEADTTEVTQSNETSVDLFDDNTRAAEAAYQSLTLTAEDEAILNSVPDDEIPDVLPKSMRTGVNQPEKQVNQTQAGWKQDKAAKVLQALSSNEDYVQEDTTETTSESRRRDVLATVKDKAVRSKRDMVQPDRKITVQTKQRDSKRSYMCESERKPLNAIDDLFNDLQEDDVEETKEYTPTHLLEKQFGSKAEDIKELNFSDVLVRDTKNFHYLTHDKSFGYTTSYMEIDRKNRVRLKDLTKSDSFIYQVQHFSLPTEEILISVKKDSDKLHVLTSKRYMQFDLLSDLEVPDKFHDLEALSVWFEGILNATTFGSKVMVIDHNAEGEFNPENLRVLRYGVIEIEDDESSYEMHINNVLFNFDFNALLDVIVRIINHQTDDFSFITSCFKR